MKRPDEHRIERQGVAHCQNFFDVGLGWVFREQTVGDYGIDAQVEVVENGGIKGKLLAVQIKSGESYMREALPDGWVFRPKDAHVKYWLSHSLPVIVVLFDPRSRRSYWQSVTKETLARGSRGGWKLYIPQNQQLDVSSGRALSKLAEGDPYVLRMRSLQLSRPWMDMLAAGIRLFIEMDDWINKTAGRGVVKLSAQEESGEEVQLAEWWFIAGFYDERVPEFFAWADIVIDEDVYYDYDYAQFELECGIWDSEDQRYYIFEEFSVWRKSYFGSGIRPYMEDGEVAKYRLELMLNDLGRSFLIVDRYLNNDSAELLVGDEE